MNYCTKCDSYYEKPGTCNCYAVARPVIYPQPWYPVPTYPPVWPQPTWITVTNNNDGTYYAPPIVNNGALPFTSGYSVVT